MANTTLQAQLEQATHKVELLAHGPLELFATRALRAIASLLTFAKESELSAAAAAETDIDVLVRALESNSLATALKARDPLAPARLRGLKRRGELLRAEGGMMTAAVVAKLLRLTRQAVDNRRRAGQLIALQVGRRGYLYPAWQFTDRGVLEGLAEVLSALKVHSDWSRLIFFLNRNLRTEGRTPLRVLRSGDRASVLRAAGAYLEHGAA